MTKRVLTWSVGMPKPAFANPDEISGLAFPKATRDRYSLQSINIQKTLIHANHLPVMIIHRRGVLRDPLFIVIAPIIGRDSEEFYNIHIRLQEVFFACKAGAKLLKETQVLLKRLYSDAGKQGLL
jgi:hypothetical protein